MQGKIIGEHEYYGHNYGFDVDEIRQIREGNETYLTDTCDVDAALKLRDSFPDIVEIIGLNPSVDLQGNVLDQRIQTYTKQQAKEHIQNMKQRQKLLPYENMKMEILEEYGIKVIRSISYESQFEEIKQIIQGGL